MTILDWVLVVVWAGIALAGFWKGAIRLVFGLGGIALGIWLALAIGDELALAIGRGVGHPWLATGLGYLLPVVVAAALCMLAGWGMERTLEAAKLGCLNRLLGAALAGVVAAVVLALVLLTAVGLSPQVARFEEGSALLAGVRVATGRPVRDQPAAAPAETDDEGEGSGDS
jgi:uncharacterized membrane protein required for colicin V production